MYSGNSWKKLIYTKVIFSQCNIFTNINISFCYQFSDFFSVTAKEVNKIKNINNRSRLYCSSPCFRILLSTHYGSLQCFLICFRKLNEIRVSRPKFSDYVISSDYDYNQQSSNLFLAWHDHESACQHKYIIYMYNKSLLFTRQALALYKNILT